MSSSDLLDRLQRRDPNIDSRELAEELGHELKSGDLDALRRFRGLLAKNKGERPFDVGYRLGLADVAGTLETASEVEADEHSAIEAVRARPLWRAIVEALSEKPALPSDLARTLARDAGQISRTLGQMRKTGVVDVWPLPDGRTRAHRLTPRGLRCLEALEQLDAVKVSFAETVERELLKAAVSKAPLPSKIDDTFLDRAVAIYAADDLIRADVWPKWAPALNAALKLYPLVGSTRPEAALREGLAAESAGPASKLIDCWLRQTPECGDSPERLLAMTSALPNARGLNFLWTACALRTAHAAGPRKLSLFDAARQRLGEDANSIVGNRLLKELAQRCGRPDAALAQHGARQAAETMSHAAWLGLREVEKQLKMPPVERQRQFGGQHESDRVEQLITSQL